MDQEKIGLFISKLRKEKGMTQEELGNLVGVTGKAVSRWERGNGVPDISIVNTVSEILGVTTTELLNGERVKSLKDINLDEITENSIDFYRTKLIQKFKKVLTILLSIIVILLLIILSIFYVNNYNKCQLYRITSNSPEISLSGILAITNNSNVLVISDFKYKGHNENIDLCHLEYEILAGNETLIKLGDISNYYSNDFNNNIKDFIKSINIYYSDLSNRTINNIIKKNIMIKIKGIDDNNIQYTFNIPLKITKEFSNSKILYFK